MVSSTYVVCTVACFNRLHSQGAQENLRATCGHLRSLARTGCVQVASKKKISAVTCVQYNSFACSLKRVVPVSADICGHLRASASFVRGIINFPLKYVKLVGCLLITPFLRIFWAWLRSGFRVIRVRDWRWLRKVDVIGKGAPASKKKT